MTEQEQQVQALYDNHKEAIGFDTKQLLTLVMHEMGVSADRARRLTEGLRANVKTQAEDKALYLKKEGLVLQDIANIIGVSQTTIQAYIRTASKRAEPKKIKLKISPASKALNVKHALMDALIYLDGTAKEHEKLMELERDLQHMDSQIDKVIAKFLKP